MFLIFKQIYLRFYVCICTCLCVGWCVGSQKRYEILWSWSYRQSEHLTLVQENDIEEILSFQTRASTANQTSLQSWVSRFYWSYGTSFLFHENLLILLVLFPIRFLTWFKSALHIQNLNPTSYI